MGKYRAQIDIFVEMLEATKKPIIQNYLCKKLGSNPAQIEKFLGALVKAELVDEELNPDFDPKRHSDCRAKYRINENGYEKLDILKKSKKTLDELSRFM